MLRLLMLMLALMSCAHADAPASSPLAGMTETLEAVGRSTQQLATPRPPLNDIGVRELLAGFELQLGDERAKAARAMRERDAANRYGDAEKTRADNAILWQVLAGVGGGALGIGLGVVFGVLLERGHEPAKSAAP